MTLEFVLITILLLGGVYLYIRYRQVQAENRRFKEHLNLEPLRLDQLLKNIHAYILLISDDFEVLRTNRNIGRDSGNASGPRRVGDLIRCTNAVHSAGCGEHHSCTWCPLRKAISEAFQAQSGFTDIEATLQIEQPGREETVGCAVSVSGSCLRVEKEDRMLLTIHEVSHQKESRKIEINRPAGHFDKLHAAFLANISHEIRTPLNAIIGFSNLLDTDNRDERELYLEIINRNNEQLLQLINDILDLSKIESGVCEISPSPIEAGALMSNLGELARKKLAEAGTAVQLICDTPPEDVRFHSDERLVLKVLDCLVSNAVKFTDQGSIHFGYRLQDGQIRFSVTDTGTGIPLDRQKHIFDRFVKLDGDKAGIGIGLSLCRLIAEKLRGSIGVDSTPGSGSTFWFSLPLDAPRGPLNAAAIQNPQFKLR